MSMSLKEETWSNQQMRHNPCITKNGHQGSNPGGRNFVVLNVSLNKKLFFVSEVVHYKNQSLRQNL